MTKKFFTYQEVAELLGFSDETKEIALEKMGIFLKEDNYWVKNQKFRDVDSAADYAYRVYFKDAIYDEPVFGKQEPTLTITKRLLGFSISEMSSSTKNLIATSKRKLTEKISTLSAQHQGMEIEKYTDMLSNLDADEIAGGLVLAIDFSHRTKEISGIDLYEPIATSSLFPNLRQELQNEIDALKNKGDYATAAPYVIWAHTLSASNYPMLRKHGRAMWAELSRAFPHLETAAKSLLEINGFQADITDGDRFPRGMTPAPKD
jgi:hypothetical protein